MKIRLVFVLCALLLLSNLGQVFAEDVRYLPPAFGIISDDYNNPEVMDSERAELGVDFDYITVYRHFGLSSTRNFQADSLAYARENGETVIVTWEPWNPEEGMNQSTDWLSEIANGSLDNYIVQFAHDIRAYGGPVFLNFAHEANGDWYPWAQRPLETITAYQHIHEVFGRVGVTNVTYAWTMNALLGAEDLTKWYPGDFVDVIGIDVYNWGTTHPEWNSQWVPFETALKHTYDVLSEKYSQPLYIGETGSTEQGGSKAEWITAAFKSLQTEFPRVIALNWFNLDKETNWRYDSSEASTSAMRVALVELKQGKYVPEVTTQTGSAEQEVQSEESVIIKDTNGPFTEWDVDDVSVIQLQGGVIQIGANGSQKDVHASSSPFAIEGSSVTVTFHGTSSEGVGDFGVLLDGFSDAEGEIYSGDTAWCGGETSGGWDKDFSYVCRVPALAKTAKLVFYTKPGTTMHVAVSNFGVAQ